MSKFTGAWPALVTPFTETNEVNSPVLKELAEYLIQKGAAGFYLCGATGQGLSMSVAERKRVLETVIEQVGGHIRLTLLDSIHAAIHQPYCRKSGEDQ